MTYDDTLRWMFAQLPMYQKKGKTALNAKLDNSLLFDKTLGQPHKKFKAIHVAGTNGKGSCSHMMASVLQEAGYRVGLYTSPHLKDFRERIKVNGRPASKKFVIHFIEAHRVFLERHQLSFFEMTVGMAFAYFAEQQVDVAVIEVGLGGRLDSTNIITPEACLITNIGHDHMGILGDTLPKIAVEKAGIIKEGVPIVISERQAETTPVFSGIAAIKNAPLTFAEDTAPQPYTTDLLGKYQQKNVKGVVATLGQLKDFDVRPPHIQRGLAKVVGNTGLLGRWQVLQDHPKVICDTAHNKEALKIVLHQLTQEAYNHLFIVLGFVADKNIGELLPLFPKQAHYFFVAPNIPRALSGAQLQDLAAEASLKGAVCQSVVLGLDAALRLAAKEDVIYVGGSTFVVAEVV